LANLCGINHLIIIMTLKKDELFYSKYYSSSTLIKNCQSVIMTDYVIC